jgi:hypothetical protein
MRGMGSWPTARHAQPAGKRTAVKAVGADQTSRFVGASSAGRVPIQLRAVCSNSS